MKKENFIIQTTATDSANTKVILEGQLVIRNAAIIKKELLSALANSQNLELIFKNVTRADIAFLQLLVALQKSAAASLEKKIVVDMAPSGYMESVIRSSGFETCLLHNTKA